MKDLIAFRKRRKRRRTWPIPAFSRSYGLWALLGVLLFFFLAPLHELSTAISTGSFAMCDRPPHNNCVMDGDTFYFETQSIRIADIDAPETHPARCSYEARLGAQATRRLLELLNVGPFEMRNWGGRDEDQYGRKLRTLVRDGRSLGGILVSEGLAREWTGRRRSWCG